MGRGSTDDYQRKRDFTRTPEPQPSRSRRPGAREAVFVVHRHEARRLHWDLRLEMGGALASWAVPKGFSYDPRDKRLAVRTEDHPLEYEHFSGVIPKGQYGAGTMTIWDRGCYAFVEGHDARSGFERGELKLRVFGRKLRGEWHLVQTKAEEGRNWLLFKSRDRYSGPSRDTALGIDLDGAPERALPARVGLMRAAPGKGPFSDPGWLFEMAFEGRRVLAEKRGSAVRFRGLRAKLPAVAADLAEARAENALFDGVLVALDDRGLPSRELLERVLPAGREEGLVYYAFDLLYWEDYDLRPLGTLERKRALRAALAERPHALFVDHVSGDGEDLARAAAEAGLSALVAKRSDAPYASGRSQDWLELAVERGDPPVARPASSGVRPRRSRVRFTNVEKVFWPAEGYTKGDLIAWYEAVAEVLLPYLVDRPVHMERFPDGIEGKSFFQRQVKPDAPSWVRRVEIESSHREAAVPHMVCDDRDTLLWIANQGSIDLHPWLSRTVSLDSPDWAIIDLDAKDAPFVNVVRVAKVTGRTLRGVGLRPLLKTSGKSGLHIYVPLEPGYTYDHSRMFCEGIARAVRRELPDISSVERDPGSRAGKVYLDFLQNRRSATVVPPYVPRPVPGAHVSTPLSWDELDGDLSPARFTLRTVLPRLEERGDLFRACLTDRQDLLPAIGALEEMLRSG